MSEIEIRERVTNVLLMLYLIRKGNTEGNIENRLKLQKLIFLSQRKLVEKKLKAFSYNFFRWLRGPFSKNLSIDLDTMCKSGFLSTRYGKIELTPKGNALLDDCSELLEENNHFLTVVDNVVKKHSKKTPDEIKELVYDIKVVVPRIHQIMAIRDILPSQLILFKIADKNARAIFRLDSSWLATLELSFDKEAMDSLSHAVDDALEGRVYESPLRDNSA